MFGPQSQRAHLVGLIAIAAATVVLAAACSSGDSASSTTAAPAKYEPRSAEMVSGPIEGGTAMAAPQPAPPLPDGYTEEEFFIGGEADSFVAEDMPSNGMWAAETADSAEYETRVIVRRPPTEDFSGTVLVEWLNVSAVEASPDWGYISEEAGREGHAYVAVSVQEQGVMGGETILEFDVDEDAVKGESGADSSGLVNIDPVRYGDLHHPGDAYSYDIYSQVGRALVDDADLLLGGLMPEQVIALGESQSAFFMTTYANAIQPLADVYDGFMVHSRGGGAAPLDGAFAVGGDSSDPLPDEAVLIRSDLGVPVFIFEAETDLTLLDYSPARQDDTDSIRTWEIAGTAHADQQVIRAILGGPRDPNSGSLLGCNDPINTGPHKETYQAALNHMVGWASGGEAPPKGERLEISDASDDAAEGAPTVAIVRDADLIAVGGVRNPLVDVPVFAPTGDPAVATTVDTFDICSLFGTTHSFDQSKIVEMHGSAEQYVADFTESANAQVAAGFLLQPDADALIAEANENKSLFG